MQNIRKFTLKFYTPESRHHPLFFASFLLTDSSRKKPNPPRGEIWGAEGRLGWAGQGGEQGKRSRAGRAAGGWRLVAGGWRLEDGELEW